MVEPLNFFRPSGTSRSGDERMGKMKALVAALMAELPPHLRFQAFRSRSTRSNSKGSTPRTGSAKKARKNASPKPARSRSASENTMRVEKEEEEESKKQEHIRWAKAKMNGGSSFLP